MGLIVAQQSFQLSVLFCSCLLLSVWCTLAIIRDDPAHQTSRHLYDELVYNEVLFAGTHNSAINLGASTVLRPAEAVGGKWPSEAHPAYQVRSCTRSPVIPNFLYIYVHKPPVTTVPHHGPAAVSAGPT